MQITTTRKTGRSARSNAGLRRVLALGVTALALVLAGVAAAEGPVVNVNTATFEELQALPGVGASRATAILETRKARGGFRSADDLLEVKGIGASSLERMRPHVRVSGPSRVAGSDEP